MYTPSDASVPTLSAHSRGVPPPLPPGEDAAVAPARRVPAEFHAGLADTLSRHLLDELDDAIIICDDERRPVLLNHAARATLATGEPLGLDEGRLRAADRGFAGLLDGAIRSAGSSGRRQMLDLHAGGERRFIVALPVLREGLSTGLVILLIGRRGVCPELAVDMLAHLHDLTASERRVLGSLLAGHTPVDIAAAKGVALSTVRTQISALRAKLGVTSIDGLIRLAAKLPSVTTALRQLASRSR